MTRTRYPKAIIERDTYSYYIERAKAEQVAELVRLGVFESKSHAADEAFGMLLRSYAPALREAQEREGKAA